jgi:hypothetical protein
MLKVGPSYGFWKLSFWDELVTPTPTFLWRC